MPSFDALVAELHAVGAGERPHVHGTLAAHLSATAALLRGWGAREALCIAGLYHAVYGTDGYRRVLCDVDMRSRVAQLIGRDAETVVYLYGACDRPAFYPRIGTAAQLLFADRFRQAEYPISACELADVCELVLANEVELAGASAKYRAAHAEELSELFERMQPLVSAAGFRAYRALLRGGD